MNFYIIRYRNLNFVCLLILLFWYRDVIVFGLLRFLSIFELIVDFKFFVEFVDMIFGLNIVLGFGDFV